MLHFHFIPNASFFIAFLGHTQTHTHTDAYANGKWQLAQARAAANSPRWAALFASLCAARERERERASARERAASQRGQHWTEQNKNETK